MGETGSTTDPKVIEQKALSLPDQARSLTITDQTTFDRAGSKLRDIVTVRAEIVAYHAPLKAAAWRTHKAICDAESGMLKPVQDAEFILKRAITAYEQEKLKIQKELEDKARKEAKEESERLRLKQIEDEKALAQQSMDALLASAQTFEEAQAIINQTPIVVADAVSEAESAPPLPIQYEVEPQIRRTAGVSTFTTYYAEVFSIKDLCAAIAEGSAAESLVVPDMGRLNKLAGVMKGKMDVPGVRVRERVEVRARKR